MRVLVACEFSGVVTKAFRDRGHLAYSCDLLPSLRNDRDASGLPVHLQGDVLEVLEDGWDLLIAHPPCTFLCSSGLHWNKRIAGREEKTHEALLFVLNLLGDGFIAHGIPRVALENPIGRISSAYRKPDQVIHPWQFGHPESKQTALWLKNLPKLQPTNILCPTRFQENGRPRWDNQTGTGQNKLGPSADRWAKRSITYQGIANAMADQWSNFDGLATPTETARVDDAETAQVG